MPGKRAKPSPWRFLRLVPVALVCMVVCAMLGLFLLLQDPGGGDQAHDAGVDPVPSSSQEQGATGPGSTPAGSPSSSTSATAIPPQQSTTAPDPDVSPVANQSPTPSAPEVRSKRPSGSTTQPVQQATKAPTPEPSIPAAGPAQDNPGKKKGLLKHGPHDHRNR